MNTLKKDDKIKYPHFLTDKPEGKDLFVGQSQERIADNIVQYITENNDNNRKVIGIEGEWGSGKSNVIEILRRKLKDQYYFFVFDAWGHQEDLTRRSILEELLTKLISEDILTIKAKISEGEKNEWKTKLNDLLAKKKDTTTKTIPYLSPALIVSIILIILTPILKSVADSIDKKYDYLKLLITSLPSLIAFIIAVFLLIYEHRKNKKKNPKHKFINSLKNFVHSLIAIYKDKNIETTINETISEKEPSVLQFISFLAELEQGTKDNIKLVIVFDNMDRLPADKVKEIWSSIHTFFGSDDNGLKTWAIVPFDNEHICNIFIDDDEDQNKNKHRADSYIHKTFSLVFHIPPPILSNWKKFFSDKFEEAFGYIPPVVQQLETIFDYHHLSDPKIKPRDIICFVNDLVALKKLWDKEIEFKYLAVFALKRNEIIKNPFVQIVSRDYLASLKTLFEFDQELDTNISALAFNVPKIDADEILLKWPIEKALNGNGDLMNICNHKSFFTVFDSVFYSDKPPVIVTTNLLNSLSEKFIDNEYLKQYWEKISDILLTVEFDLDYVPAIMTIIKNVKNHSKIEQTLKFLFSNAIVINNRNNDKHNFYYGNNYYRLITEVDSLLQGLWEGKSVKDVLFENKMSPEEYLEFITNCPENYSDYKVTCDAKELNIFLIAKFDSESNQNISQYYSQLKILKQTTDLTDFTSHINNIIPSITPDLNRSEIIISLIYDIGKILANEEGLLFNIPEHIAIQILIRTPEHLKAVDLLLSIIKWRITNRITDTNEQASILAILNNNGHLSEFINNYEYYFNYSDLVKYNLQFFYPLTTSAIIEITQNTKSVKGADVCLLLGSYAGIKVNFFANKIELCNSFIAKLNSFYTKLDDGFISDSSLQNIIQIISDNYLLDNSLINDIIWQANEFIIDLDRGKWISALKDSTKSPNCELLYLLIFKNKFRGDKLPTNLNAAYFEVLKTISKKETAIPSNIDFWNALFEMHSSNINSTLKDIRDELLNHDHGAVTLEEVMFFENCLFYDDILDDTKKIADDALRRILTPLASSDMNYNYILKNNSKTIEKIVGKAQDSIIDFKNAIDPIRSTFQDNDPDINQFYEPLNAKVIVLTTELNKDKTIEVPGGG